MTTQQFHSRSALVSVYRNNIVSNRSFAIQGLLFVFNRQLEDEVAANETHYKNRIGFNKADARILTQIAKNHLDGKDLSEEEIIEVNNRMPKYARQIVKQKIRSGEFVKQNGFYVRQ